MSVVDIEDYKPHINVNLSKYGGGIHIFPVSTIEDIASGKILDENHNLICQCIAVALLDHVRDES